MLWVAQALQEEEVRTMLFWSRLRREGYSGLL